MWPVRAELWRTQQVQRGRGGECLILYQLGPPVSPEPRRPDSSQKGQSLVLTQGCPLVESL